MELLSDPRLLVFLVIAFVWIHRSRRSIQTLHRMPIIDSAFRDAASDQPLISVIIPAKNEETNIGACLERFLAQDYSKMEIIVANDNSTDRTAKILETFREKITVVSVPPTPEGWTGKNFAIHSAMSKAQGSWFLFTDADTRHEPSSLSAAWSHAASRSLDFLTLLPRCLAETFAERIIQPIAMGYLGLWFPIDKINDPKHPMAFANGQYMLMKRQVYEKIGGHAEVRGEFLEDFAMMQKIKAAGLRGQCALGVSVYGTRMYHSLDSIWRGWRRIYLHAFKKNAPALLLKSLGVIFFSVLPFFWCVQVGMLVRQYQARPVTLALAVSVIVIILITCLKTFSIVKAQKRYAFLHPVAAFFLAMILLDASWVAATSQKTHWR